MAQFIWLFSPFTSATIYKDLSLIKKSIKLPSGRATVEYNGVARTLSAPLELDLVICCYKF